MLLDAIHGTIDRRVLLNYRIKPDILQHVLPAPFRPKTYADWGVDGICMIRFRGLRPKGIPAALGMNSQNAAHRIAVTWNQDGEEKEGVYIPRRDSNSWFNTILSGTVFPGIFNRSRFQVKEGEDSVSVRITHEDGGEEASFMGETAEHLPATSIFPTLEEAAGFFSLGATGYSATHQAGHYHGMELKTLDCTIKPLVIHEASSHFFSNAEAFPPGSVQLDNALLMKNVKHEWHSRPDLYLSGDKTFLTVKRT